MPAQVAPPSAVLASDVHGAELHGAVPSTHPRWAETKVADWASNPAGTRPPTGTPGTPGDVVDGTFDGEIVVDVSVVVVGAPTGFLAPAPHPTIPKATKLPATITVKRRTGSSLPAGRLCPGTHPTESRPYTRRVNGRPAASPESLVRCLVSDCAKIRDPGSMSGFAGLRMSGAGPSCAPLG